jgi:hypothetical protein
MYRQGKPDDIHQADSSITFPGCIEDYRDGKQTNLPWRTLGDDEMWKYQRIEND